jgi:CHAT domain-containing protein
MQQSLIEAFAATASEAEALNHTSELPFTRDVFLSAARHVPRTDEAAYAHVWHGKAAVTRVFEQRRQALLLEADPAARDLGRQLAGKRQELARLLLAPVDSRPDLAVRVRKLTDDKEDLERRLGRTVAAFRTWQERQRLAPDELRKRLPEQTAFVDLLRYYRIEQDPKKPGKAGERITPCYVAFVLARDHPVRRVELGEAKPIDEAVADWRRAIVRGEDSPAAALRKLVWLPLDLPAATRTVVLAPDGPLTGVPWAALPGAKPGSALIEDHLLAVVPHGRFLLEHLLIRPPAVRDTDRLLAVGAIDYDKEPVAIEKAPEAPARGPETGGKKLTWKNLPATQKELEEVLGLAGKRTAVSLRGTEAGSGQLLRELTQVRWAHLATHGFFADRTFRSALELNEDDYKAARDYVRGVRERKVAGMRSPLVLSGLVLAGANLPDRDDGVLTAEALAGLDLSKLELAVLSACETGLGDVAGGEGVFGLQRAFHLAGTRNVVASLWKVDDEATSVLMRLFYRNLWHKEMPALEALCEAQRYLYRNPKLLPALAKLRGPDFDKEVSRPAEPPKGTEPKPGDRAAVKLWAGFVLSGPGR